MTFISQFSLFFLRTVRDNLRIMIVFPAFLIFQFHLNSENFEFTFHNCFCPQRIMQLALQSHNCYLFFCLHMANLRNYGISQSWGSFSLNLFQNSKLISQFWLIYSEFTFMHLADAFIQSDLQCIQVPWESNLQPFALLTQCSTTEPHRNTVCFTEFCEKSQNCEINSQNLHLAI